MTTAEIELPFAGKTYEKEHDHPRLRDQTLRVYETMLDAKWRTLGEIADITNDPEASISARLRDLRKAEFGSFNIKRQRRGLATTGLFEYQLQPPWESEEPEERPAVLGKKTGFLKGLMYAGEILAKAESLGAARALLRSELLKAALK